MKLKELRSILYSSRGGVQMAVLYNRTHNKDIDSGSVEYIAGHYPEIEVDQISAFEDYIIITTEEV